MNRKTCRQTIVFILILVALYPSTLMASKPTGAPNLITILVDDMGWKDTGFSGNTLLDTPHLDQLAQSGIIFTQAYAAAPNCAPSRACLMTGQYTPRHGVYTVVDDRHKPGRPYHKIVAAHSNAALNPDAVTIAEALREQGYATGMVGMWNLGRGRRGPETPTGQGFDSFLDPKHLGFHQDAYQNDKGEYLTHKMTAAGINFIQKTKAKPFFLYLAYHAVHAPFEPEAALLAKYEKKKSAEKGCDPALAATIEALDISIGRLMAALKDLGLADNTYILFTSDNGGTRHATAPLKAGKGSLYEGGIRVPAFVAGPGIKPAQISEVPISSIDFYPTLLELAGAPPRPVDGKSLVALMKAGKELSRQSLFWHFPCYIGQGKPSSAIRYGNLKLIEFFETGTIEMYNLENDPGETTNLAERNPEQARQLYVKLKDWQVETNAPRLFEPNPYYDPSAKTQRDRKYRGKGGKK